MVSHSWSLVPRKLGILLKPNEGLAVCFGKRISLYVFLLYFMLLAQFTEVLNTQCRLQWQLVIAFTTFQCAQPQTITFHMSIFVTLIHTFAPNCLGGWTYVPLERFVYKQMLQWFYWSCHGVPSVPLCLPFEVGFPALSTRLQWSILCRHQIIFGSHAGGHQALRRLPLAVVAT